MFKYLLGLMCLMAPLASAQCLDHEGLRHCALDQTKLQAASGTLAVDGPGVQVSFAPVISWNAALTWDADLLLRLDATDRGQALSSLILDQNSDRLAMSASFTGQPDGSPATLMIYQGGNLQHFIPDAVVAITDPMRKKERPRQTHFRNQAVTGACIWTLTFEEAVPVTINQQTYLADQIEFVEQMGSGHYPYASFDGIRISGTAPFQIGLESVGCSP